MVEIEREVEGEVEARTEVEEVGAGVTARLCEEECICGNRVGACGVLLSMRSAAVLIASRTLCSCFSVMISKSFFSDFKSFSLVNDSVCALSSIFAVALCTRKEGVC